MLLSTHCPWLGLLLISADGVNPERRSDSDMLPHQRSACEQTTLTYWGQAGYDRGWEINPMVMWQQHTVMLAMCAKSVPMWVNRWRHSVHSYSLNPWHSPCFIPAVCSHPPTVCLEELFSRTKLYRMSQLVANNAADLISPLDETPGQEEEL